VRPDGAQEVTADEARAIAKEVMKTNSWRPKPGTEQERRNDNFKDQTSNPGD
jgi:hypothetical protein